MKYVEIYIFLVLVVKFANADLGIIWGKKAPPMPYQASLQASMEKCIEHPTELSSSHKDALHFCSGSIISEKYIVTTFHCHSQIFILGNKIENLSVAVGTLDLADVVDENRYCIKKTQRHDKFYSEALNDINLIELTRPLNFNDRKKIAPIQIYEKIIEPATKITVSGFGLNEKGETGILRQTEMLTLDDDYCEFVYKLKAKKDVFYAKDFSTDLCKADSGGPATVEIKAEIKLVGIISRGKCIVNHPNDIIKISYHYDWLNKNAELLQ